MIAVGGTVGADSVGGGAAIDAAGPGVILAYMAAGALVVLIMRWLTPGRMYARAWAVIVRYKATAGAALLHRTPRTFPHG